MKTIYIYTLSHPITGEVRYVGKSNKPSIRYGNHLCSKAKTHTVSWIKSLAKNDLKPMLRKIDKCQEIDWIWLEQYWIAQFKAWGFSLTNHTIGGDGASGYVMSEEHKAKISAGLKKNIQENGAWLTGTKQSEATKMKRSKTMKGRKNTWQKGVSPSDETKAKLSFSRIGEKNHRTILTEDRVKEIKTLLKKGELSQRKIAKYLGIKPHFIFNIAEKKSWAHVKI